MKYNKVYIISNPHNISLNYLKDTLNKLNIIDENENWNINQTAVVYNLNNLDKNHDQINLITDFIISLKKKEDMYNNKIMIIYKNMDYILKLDDNYIIHHSQLKDQIDKQNIHFKGVNMNNFMNYIHKLLNKIFVKKQSEDINIIKPRNENKVDNVFDMNKLYIIHDYKQGDKIYSINDPSFYYKDKTSKYKDLTKIIDKSVLEIINGNQFTYR